MDFEHYIKKTRETAVYPDEYERDYVIHGLVDELGELLETVEKTDGLTRKSSAEICKEMGDCTWYLARIFDHFGFEPKERPDNEYDLMLYQSSSGRGQSLVQEALIKAARINGHQKKSVRDDKNREDGIKQEARGIFGLLEKAAFHFGFFDLEVVMNRNLDKLFDRKERGVLKGDGDNR